MCNSNMSVMLEYFVAVCLMTTFVEGCKVRYGDRAIDPEYFVILYEIVFNP